MFQYIKSELREVFPMLQVEGQNDTSLVFSVDIFNYKTENNDCIGDKDFIQLMISMYTNGVLLLRNWSMVLNQVNTCLNIF